MNLRRKAPPDSLYLLLDTLCNAFGGIILLAVLVVLLTSKEKTQTVTPADSQEMLQRRLALAAANLEQSLRLAATLNAQATNHQVQQQMTLLSTRKDLQDAIQATHDANSQNRAELESASAADPAERLKFLNTQLALAQARKLDAQNRLLAAGEDVTRTKQRLTNAEQLVTAKLNELQRPLRLPKEHRTGKRVVFILLRYGRYYPCFHEDKSHNDTDIKWTTKSDGRDIAEPYPDKGLDAAGVANFLAGLSPDNLYVAFVVYEDSFPAFIRAKQLALADGISYGWDVFRIAEGPVGFATGGHMPPPQ